MSNFGPMELHEIGEAVTRSLPDPEPVVVYPDEKSDGETRWERNYSDSWLGERVVEALERRGYTLVREGER